MSIRYGAVVLLIGALCATAATAQERGRTAVSLPETFTEQVTGMEFVLVKGGCYEMGDTFNEGGRDEQPLHTVCLEDFYMGKYEVTNAQFRAFVDATKYRTTEESKGTGWGLQKDGPGDWKDQSGLNWRHPIWPGDSIEKKMDHPVVQVSWNDAKEFARWLSTRTGRAIRLPTEAEWEYAARSGGKKDRFSWGNGDPSGNVADTSFKKVQPKAEVFPNYDDGFKYTAPVGSFKPNELGIYDMTGNVWEWCQDWYGEQYYEESPKRNPTGPASGLKKVDRGGSWSNMPSIARAANRDDADPNYAFFNVGFRLVLPVSSVR